MRTKLTFGILGLVLTLAATSTATAQLPYGGYGGYGGLGALGRYGGVGAGAYGYGGYRGSGGMLSPYLNLVNRGFGNAATNYYNFVRPGLINPATAAPFASFGPTYMNRPPLFPQTTEEDEDRRKALSELSERTDQAKQQGLPPTGHAMFFNETFGFFGPQSSTPGMGMGGRSAPAARLGRPR